MSQILKFNTAFLYEPRQLFHHAARHCIEASGCPVNNIGPDGIMEDVFSFINPGALIAVGLSGAGQELYTLLKIIHQATENRVNLVVWLPEQDKYLADLMRVLGVNSLLCETLLTEELPHRLNNPLFSSSHFPFKLFSISRGGTKSKLSRKELDVLIECARGLDVGGIASSCHIAHKTVYAHIHNARAKLNLEDRTCWFNLLNGLQKISSTK